ncbi:MAG: MBL fold metallo-hydrolase [Dysgonomonas sp.]|nr:MBL fold metallo-hydrolase [Dysgonomonas sp.]
MWILLSIIAIIVVAVLIFINQPSFGRTPRGERMERIKNSPNYRDGKFQNLSETQQITSDKGFIGSMFDFLFRKIDSLRPEEDIPAIKTNLNNFNPDEDLLVWFGHSSYLLQVDRKRILVDPVFYKASPVSFVNTAFKGTNIYSPKDIPNIDYLIISHDHWDHLDYETVMELKPRIKKVICGIGVGEHFEYWGFKKDQIIELDWNEDSILNDGFFVYCLPARHFSGRGLSPNQSLWASYLIKTPSKNIYIGGDSGYDTHYAEIGKRFPDIDLAILENGQYDVDWKYIHLLPSDLVQAAKDLNAKKLLTVHNSKYALGKHAWNEPLVKISEVADKDSLHLITPMIGEIANLNDSTQVFKKWWENRK